MRFLTENGMYAVVADPGMVISFPGGYCNKLYRKTNDFSDCVEIEAPSEDDPELTAEEALEILLGGST